MNKFQISLMENDVSLLQKLLALGDSIQELKSKQLECSQISMDIFDDDSYEEDDERVWSRRANSPCATSFSEVTHLYVNDEPNDGIQYFSRKNSVLRIPIPPRSSNRMNPNRRIPRRPSELARPTRKHDIADCTKLENFYDEADLMAIPTTYSNSSSRRSNASVDSGIRDISPSSETIDGSPSSTRRNSPSNTIRNCKSVNTVREYSFCGPIIEESRS